MYFSINRLIGIKQDQDDVTMAQSTHLWLESSALLKSTISWL